jgi:hypothetical protein
MSLYSVAIELQLGTDLDPGLRECCSSRFQRAKQRRWPETSSAP